MADQNAKTLSFRMKLGTRGLLGSLVTNLTSKLRNPKWRIQYGRSKFTKLVDPDKTPYSRAFGLAGYESELEIQKFKMADPVSLTKMQKVGRSGSNSLLASFSGLTSTNLKSKFQIQNGGSSMVDQNAKS